MVIDFSGLNNFKQRVNNLRRLEKLEDKILDYGVNFARERYSSTDIVVKKEPHRIVASGDNVAFREFGTGYLGLESDYPYEKLPKQDITFTNGNKTITTKGWNYYYPNKRTKRFYKGKAGWFKPGGEFTEGNYAYADMWETVTTIKDELKNLAKAIIKRGYNGK